MRKYDRRKRTRRKHIVRVVNVSEPADEQRLIDDCENSIWYVKHPDAVYGNPELFWQAMEDRRFLALVMIADYVLS
ncbi:hypothetical protein [Endozoicomonas ascidiicola]|uniref:hypothetical protein n=1 Tax=Endozoicomonas ascidiicola TaxID=1698521 RepID=UPI000A921EB9|nr:hypothetical protein [Endozoicomonas ascidiicola]